METGNWESSFEEEQGMEMEVPEIDGSILTELLEETNQVEVEEEKVGLDLMQPHENCEDCGLDNIILSDLDSSKYYPTYDAEGDPFDWVEMETCDWYIDECFGESEMVGVGDARGYYSSSYCYGEASKEQVYSPLWE